MICSRELAAQVQSASAVDAAAGTCGRAGRVRARACRASRLAPQGRAGRGVLLVLVAGYAVFYGMWSVRKYHAYHAPAFDMGIFDQGVWLLSRFKEPFVTILGLNLFGDHTVFIMALLRAALLALAYPGDATRRASDGAWPSGAFPIYI